MENAMGKLSRSSFILAFTLGCLLVIGLVGISAARNSTLATSATLQTDKVAINVNRITDQTTSGALAPASEVKQAVSIMNVGSDCYIRAKVDFSLEDAPFGTAAWSETGSNRADNGDAWTYHNGYWYCTQVLETGRETQFTETILYPTFNENSEGVWVPLADGDFSGNSASGATLKSAITVEAVQADNFEAAFDSANPWGDTAVEETMWFSYEDGSDQ